MPTTAKLVAFVKATNTDGSHRTWESAKFPGINYDFILTMDNQDTGTVSSKKPEGNYSIGTEYVYEKETNDHGTKFKNFKSVAAAASSGSWGGGSKVPFESHYDKPEVQEQITRKFALQQASLYLMNPNVPQEKVTPESIVELSNAMFAFCYNGVDMSTKVFAKDLLNRRSALELSIVQLPIASLKLMSWKDVATRAEVNYDYLCPKPVPVLQPNV